MRRKCHGKQYEFIPLVLTVVTGFGMAGGQPQARPAATTPPGEETIACRVVESGESSKLGIAWVVFHHRDVAERVRLSSLLREHAGGSVEFRTADGRWHPATLERLKSCFGRGLLLFASGTAHLAEKEAFSLKFPAS